MSGHVLVVGAGINGAAIARELALSGVNVVVADRNDVAFGATAYSSRLIHGGLRYLEYGEFDLVRESLHERTRLLELAPHYVAPLELFVPVANRFGGALAAARQFLGGLIPWLGPGKNSSRGGSRGSWLVGTGLTLYDLVARDRSLPRHRTRRVGDAGVPPVDAARYRWACGFYDAQVRYPERFTLALLADARQLAAERGSSFRLLNYHQVSFDSGRVLARRLNGSDDPLELPGITAVVNATGAWVDLALADWQIPGERLIGGTRGSHILSWHPPLRECLAGRGIYAEAADGRPVFILPFDAATLIGTTDLRFEGDPADAVATEEEIAYLVECVGQVFPQAGFGREHVDMHYCGVRPLPYVAAGRTSAITRRHALHRHDHTPLPTWSVIGGKLTTCRSLAEEVARAVLPAVGRVVQANSRDRPLPGAGRQSPSRPQQLAAQYGCTAEQVAALWPLWGTHDETILRWVAESAADDAWHNLPGTQLAHGVARWAIEHESVERLVDLVERRLMLLYAPRLQRACLEQLAALMVEKQIIAPDGLPAEVAATIERLEKHFGKRVYDGAAAV